jgi:RimJ/RimL family protein N-acetyltransferase
MQKLIAYLRARGTHRLTATVLAENVAMLALVEKLGFRQLADQPDPSACSIELTL